MGKIYIYQTSLGSKYEYSIKINVLFDVAECPDLPGYLFMLACKRN